MPTTNVFARGPRGGGTGGAAVVVGRAVVVSRPFVDRRFVQGHPGDLAHDVLRDVLFDDVFENQILDQLPAQPAKTIGLARHLVAAVV